MKGWRTVFFNLAAAIVPVLQVAGTDLGLHGQGLAVYALGVNAAKPLLRSGTTTPLGSR